MRSKIMMSSDMWNPMSNLSENILLNLISRLSYVLSHKESGPHSVLRQSWIWDENRIRGVKQSFWCIILSLLSDPIQNLMRILEFHLAEIRRYSFFSICQKINSCFLRFFRLAKNWINAFKAFFSLQNIKFLIFEFF